MKVKASFDTLGDCPCPVCGDVQAKMISAGRNPSFACSRCRTELEVTAFFSLPVLATSILLSLFLTGELGLQGLGFVLAIVGATAAFNWLGQSMGNIVAAPKLKVRPKARCSNLPKNVRSAHRIDQSTSTSGSESIRCPLVLTHGSD